MAARGQRGAAAVELALIFTLLCIVVLLVVPMARAMSAKIELERTAGMAARFATQAPDRSRPGLSAGQRRPNMAQVVTEAENSYPGATAAASEDTAAADCPRGAAVTVRLDATVDLGPFGVLYDLAGVARDPDLNAFPLSASATNCQE